MERAVHSAWGLGLAAAMLLPHVVQAKPQPPLAWVTSWATSPQGPFPSGAASAQPDQSFAFPDPAAGASDQSFRMIVRPSVWAGQTRLRFSNAFGTKPITIDGAFVGLQLAAASVAPRTNRPVLFSGRTEIIIAPGSELWSDPVTLPFAKGDKALLAGRKLAISFHIAGGSGPMTWHAKAMQTSYVSLPKAGSHGGENAEQSFPLSATSWFFLDAVDMRMPRDTPLVVCFGDSITDGTGSTLNGDDRWPDVLQRTLASRYPNGIAVVDEGIGSNRIVSPETYDLQTPFGGGPAALQRMDRDVAGLSGVSTVIWFEGINDLSHGETAETVIAGYRTGLARLRQAIPGVRIIGATITPSLGAKGNAGTQDTNQRRKTVNAAIRQSGRSDGLFDAYADFEQAVKDPQSDTLKAMFVPNTTIGGPGDQLHPNRAGYLAMAAIMASRLPLTPRPGLSPRVQPAPRDIYNPDLRLGREIIPGQVTKESRSKHSTSSKR